MSFRPILAPNTAPLTGQYDMAAAERAEHPGFTRVPQLDARRATESKVAPEPKLQAIRSA